MKNVKRNARAIKLFTMFEYNRISLKFVAPDKGIAIGPKPNEKKV